MNKKLRFTVQAALIAAIYVVLLFVFAPISFSAVQVRIAEALTILPFFTPAAVPGVFVGCFLGGILTGGAPIDYIFGSLTTLVAAYLSYRLRGNKYLVPLPPIILNAIVIPWVISFAYGSVPIPLTMLTVGIGEVISCGVLGLILLFALNPIKNYIFK
ncbi:substrate-specific component QueT of predicted queuosine-regulated ECF transporter [Lachnospiraceae bacterium KM106-2]|nr:substrate-specific component QueT of predicted queuosine-regulated ECF transporter [Lachnospiraceae bacterium KM106-2]